MKEEGFFEWVHEVVRLIPYGRVTSYGAIARYLGSPQAARTVGWALNKSFSDAGFIPAHRVVNRNGLLTGRHHFGYSDTMRELLESEGIIIEDNAIQNFDKVFWDPSKELEDAALTFPEDD
jgi:methylated-DNA-protein-cysteine methyltransferase-like protein